MLDHHVDTHAVCSVVTSQEITLFVALRNDSIRTLETEFVDLSIAPKLNELPSGNAVGVVGDAEDEFFSIS